MECDLNTISGRKAANSFGVWIFARSHRRQITPGFLCNKDLAALWEEDVLLGPGSEHGGFGGNHQN